MGLLDAFKKKPEGIKAFKIHPMARQAHPVAFSAWAAGGTIAGMNPETGLFEKMEFPIFDPAINYIVLNAPDALNLYQVPSVKAAEPLGFTGASIFMDSSTGTFAPSRYVDEADVPTPPAPPAPENRFIRGSVWKTPNGNQYMVIGNKYDLLYNYSTTIDPDGAPLICVRYDRGMKQAISHRNFNGTRSNSAMDLTTFVKTVNLEAIEDDNGMKILLHRKNDVVALNLYSFETKAVVL